ncbi:hypothetical protein [Mesorhizobium sp. NPDC059025]|uniref:hypothetical protein n=1 Tax=unclassified Mesorhizobium TaxID=325217 RepID=UPI0036A452D8
MTSRLNFTPAQMRAAAKVAKEFGVSVRLEVDGAITITPLANQGEKDLDLDLQQWLENRDNRLEAKKSRNEKAAESASDFAAAVAQMDPDSRKILAEGYYWEWDDFQAHVVSKPPNKREIAALEVLSKFGIGETVSHRQASIGLTTQARLEARGFIEVRPNEKGAEYVGHCVLTALGLNASKSFNV